MPQLSSTPPTTVISREVSNCAPRPGPRPPRADFVLMWLFRCAGGRSLLSRDEREEARTEAEAEFEKEERRGNKKKRSAANGPLGIDGEDDLGTLFGGGATTGKLPRFANRITLKVFTL